MTERDVNRFLSKCKAQANGCVIWTGVTNSRGGAYGRFKFNGKMMLAHRVSYLMFKGPIPEGAKVLHRCDNPSCVNPLHLFLGTLSDNVKDAVRKGRWNRPKGERHHSAKLTEAQVRAIKASPLSCNALAQAYGVSAPMISYIRRGKAWRHVV